MVAAVAAGVSLAGGVLASSAVQAEPATTSAPASLDCLSARVTEGGWTDTLTITNYCNISVEAKVVLDYARDSCITVPPSGFRGLLHFPARFNRLDEC